MAEEEIFQWSRLPPLPPAMGQEVQPGVAGPFSGVHNGALIVAGGANFPESPPWEGGGKVWWDDIFVMEEGPGGPAWIEDAAFKLPRPLAYGAAVSTPEGVACIGGCDEAQCYPDAFLLKWDPESKTVRIDPLPSLPVPLAFMAVARAGQAIYVAGGQETMKDARATKHFFHLDLAAKGNEGAFQWEALPPWPGPGRVLPVCTGQSDGLTDCFYLFSGRDIAPDRETVLLADAYSYHPSTASWKRLSDIAPDGQAPRCVMGAAGIASGTSHVLVFGGDTGQRFLELEGIARRIGKAPDDPRAELLEKTQRELLSNHPGFSRDILAYHTITDTWALAGFAPRPCPVTSAIVRYGGGFVLTSGEVRPGVRSPDICKAEPVEGRFFGWANLSVLGVYLLALVGMGIYFSRREKSTEDFFKASGRVPWWAAGLSIFGTQLSAITFMAIPAKTYATDWKYFTGNMTIVLVAPFIIMLFLPFYRRLNVTTAYEYLEKRFNLAARLIGSSMFIALHLGRIGIVLFLPSIALSVVTGIDVNACILVMGILSISYTVLGGIEAVIWTDVLQVIVLLAGAVICLAVMLFNIEGGFPGLMDMARGAGKLRIFDFAFDLTTPTFWVVLLGGLCANLISYGSDQSVIQRYLTTKDERSATRSIWTNAILCVPASILFFGIGTALYGFYRTHPRALSTSIDNGDAVFPWFIVTELPQGVAGLVIAAVFAASMSSLDSSMNSVSAAVTTDFFRRFHPKAADRTCLALARWVTVLVGAAGTVLALMMAGWGIKSLWDQLNVFIGLFAGGLGGLFLLGIFSRRAHGAGAVVGLAASGLIQSLVRAVTPVHLWLYPFTGVVSCLAVGYAASLLLPAAGKSIDGLTLNTLERKGGQNVKRLRGNSRNA